MSHHSNQSQGRLHDLFPGFAGFVSEHISTACRSVLHDSRKQPNEPIRILDLGCGAVPYASAFVQLAGEIEERGLNREVSLVLVDNDETVIKGDQIQGCQTSWRCLNALSLPHDSNALSGPFDVVILAASLHEFYFEAVSEKSERWVPGTFHEEYLSFICQRSTLLAPHGKVVLADYAWAEQADPSHLEQIAQHQRKVVEHADPPWAFAGVKRIFNSFNNAGFQVQSSDVHGLYDRLDDQRVSEQFSDLPAEVRDTLRLRLGYVLTFQRRMVVVVETEPSKIQATILYVSQASEEMFKRLPDLDERSIRPGLNDILTSSTGTPDGCPPVVSLAKQIFRDSQKELQLLRARDAGDCEVWIGIGLRSFKNSRFIPRLRSWWKPDSEPVPAGVLIRSGGSLSGLIDANAEDTEHLAGPISITFNALLNQVAQPSEAETTGTPSIHNWCVRLHHAIRENTGDKLNLLTSSLFRSVTILAPDATEHDHAISAAWGNEKDQNASGHYLFRICPESIDHSVPTSIANLVKKELDRIADQVAGKSISWLPIGSSGSDKINHIDRWIYTAFLITVFGFGDQARLSTTLDSLKNLKLSASEHAEGIDCLYESLKDGLTEYTDSIVGSREFSQYRSYTTLAFGCDGLSPNDPDTLMIFSGHPLPPTALDKISAYSSDLFRRIVQSESDAIIERQSQAQSELEATQRLVGTFGHDGKTPAMIIEQLLSESSFPEHERIAISKTLAKLLTERLEGYRWLISEPKDANAVRNQLWSQAEQFEPTWKGVDRIWKEAVSMSILSACVRTDGQWSKIREKLQLTSIDDRLRLVRLMDKPEEMIGALPNLQERNVTNGLRTPFKLSKHDREAGETTSGSLAVYHALRLVFSEILTNAFKHELPFADLSNGVKVKLTAFVRETVSEHSRDRAERVKAEINITISPAKKNENNVISGSYNGLLSMKDACRAIGGNINTQQVYLLDEEGELKPVPLPLPYFERTDGGIKWTVTNIPLFR